MDRRLLAYQGLGGSRPSTNPEPLDLSRIYVPGNPSDCLIEKTGKSNLGFFSDLTRRPLKFQLGERLQESNPKVVFLVFPSRHEL